MKLEVDIRKQLGNFLLDVTFETGDMVTGFLGASGSGKSMTLKCIAGIERPDEGRIVLDDRVLFDSSQHINIPPQKRQIGYLFQQYALFPTMTVRRNILCGLHGEKDKRKREERYRSLIELLHLEGLEKHLPWQLSGGQQQRVALARMLASSPKLLLLDEPFSALDAFLRRNLQTELSTLLTQVARQAVIVTHSPREVRRMAKSLYVLSSGTIIRHGPTEEVFSDPGSEECSRLLVE